ncbi:MAG: hypothetical protein A3H97_20300 [Acidobacteria bacterium RIFCSPLOWO2_02_FULL_65_29]|nr:MAG: hypothetical protein A3H97_20300 [Acidobacteria bacterium RIFCSPLOWO2_02_FULL_65_29]
MRARILSAITLAGALATAACFGPGPRHEYTLQGQILSVAADRKEANVKHEEITGFMPAMTMPYKVRDAAEFADLKPGDLITSTLVVVSNDAYLKDVKKVGEAPLESAPAAASSGFELLNPGEQVPNTVFIDQDGKIRDFASFGNSVVLLTFIYTKCPMPTFCPLMDRHFKAIQEKVKADAALATVHLVSVSFDPATDTPQVLKMHAGGLGADPARWTFLTGDRDEIDKFAMRFGVSIARDMTDPVNITHNLRTAIVDAKGVFVKSYTGNEWLPEQVLADLQRVVTGS